MKRIADLTTTSLEAIQRQNEAGHGCANPECNEGFVPNPSPQGPLYIPCPLCKQSLRARQAEATLRRKLEAAKIPARYLDTDWADLEMIEHFPLVQRVAGRIKEMVRGCESVVFLGPVGCGKTQSAMLLVRAAIREGIGALVANLGWYAVRVRSSWGKGGEFTEEMAVNELATPELLLLDDLGAGESDHDLERRMLYQILEFRNQNERPTIVTANFTPQEFASYLGSRALDRLKPLKMLEFKHGKNFRDRRPSVWGQP